MEYMLFGLPDAVGGTDQCLLALRPPGGDAGGGFAARRLGSPYLLRLAIQSDAAALTQLVPVGVAH